MAKRVRLVGHTHFAHTLIRDGLEFSLAHSNVSAMPYPFFLQTFADICININFVFLDLKRAVFVGLPYPALTFSARWGKILCSHIQIYPSHDIRKTLRRLLLKRTDHADSLVKSRATQYSLLSFLYQSSSIWICDWFSART